LERKRERATKMVEKILEEKPSDANSGKNFLFYTL